MPDAARLAAAVLFAKSRAPRGRPDDNQTSTWGAELGRWLGMTESTVHHDVLPVLRKTGAVRTRVVTDAKGQPTGLDCLVMPLWRARRAGGAGHPLAVTRSELAVLLRLCEVLFGPGWAPKDRAPVPAGMLASRTGRGAATDRLGLLLMVLSTNSRGWLQLCAGSVDTSRGRPAATVARLLGCSPAGGAKVLKRLEDQGVASVVRQETGSGLNGKSRVRLVAVAEAHGRAVREAREAAASVFSDLAAPASGNLETGGNAGTRLNTGMSSTGEGKSAGVADLAAAAQLHASHASVVTPGGSLSLSGRFSGEGRGGEASRPKRAGTHEDQAPNTAGGTELPVVGGGCGPLRGDKQVKLQGGEGQMAARAAGRSRLTVVDGGRGRQQQGRGVGDLQDLDLRVALAPVAGLWSRLSRGQQAVVHRAALQALEVLSGIVDERVAPQLLADRLTDRLEEVGGEALVREPMGWLLGPALVQRQACADPRCDDKIRLDTGDDCPTCGNVIQVRRVWRSRITDEVDERMPGADPAARRAAIEAGLRRRAVIEAEDAAIRRAKAEAEKVRVRAGRAAAAAAEAVREGRACADCGAVRSAGLCEECGYRRRKEDLVTQAVLTVAAWSADLADPCSVAAVAADVQTQLERGMADAREQLLALMGPDGLDDDPSARASCLAFTELQAVEEAVPGHRATALMMLARSPEAEAEAKRAYDTEKGRRQHRLSPDGPIAVAAAEQASDAARERAAQYLLAARLEKLRALWNSPAFQRGLGA
ncbi:hypothetical protein ACFY3M_48080 [Streptomyces mirabilis]|uniref:hypothetical protein n=1 Tax=Streptomyces mirabilis TaxID=68239 RepID=UPI0036824EB9